MDLTDREIRTERLLLRRFRESDLDRLAAMQALPEVARYLYWEPATREQVEPILERRIATTRLERDDDWVVLAVERQEDGLLLGDVTVFLRSVEHRQAEVGWAFHCRRLGMRQEADFRESELFKGSWGDELVFAVLATEWRMPRPY
jgi:RimJ/RimL family protein N-acetyltransferase